MTFDRQIRGQVRKRERSRLAKAELLMVLAVKAEQWASDIDPARIGQTPADRGLLPFEEWDKYEPDVFRSLAKRYGLDQHDLGRLLTSIGDELENRAIRAGFDEHWEDE